MLENKNFESKIENEIENYEESKQLISKKVMYLFEKTNYNWNLYDFFKFLEKSLNIQEIYVIPVNSSNKDFFLQVYR